MISVCISQVKCRIQASTPRRLEHASSLATAWISPSSPMTRKWTRPWQLLGTGWLSNWRTGGVGFIVQCLMPMLRPDGGVLAVRVKLCRVEYHYLILECLHILCTGITFTFICPLTVRVVGAPQMTSQPVSSIFPCSPLPSGTWRTPGLCIPWCCLPTSSSVCLFFWLLSLCLTRWFWSDSANGRHINTTSVWVSLRWSGLRVVRLPAGSLHGLPHW